MPTTSERIARVLLKVSVDRTELTNTRQQIDTFNKTLADLERQKALSRLATDSARAVSEGKSLRTTLAQMKAELVKFGAESDEIAKVVREFDRLNEAASKAAASTAGSTGNKLLRSVGTDIRNLPALPIPGTGISTDVIGKVLNTLGRLDVSLKDLAISGGLASGAVIAVALAHENYRNVLKPIETLLNGIIAAQQEVAGILASGRPQEIVDRQKAAVDELNRLEAQRAKALEQQAILANELLNKQQSPDILKALLGQPIEAAFDLAASGPLQEVQKQITDYNAQLAAQQIIVDELNKEIEEANRLLEIERAEKERLRQLDAAALARLQATLQAEQSNAAAIRDRIAALNFEQQAILKLMQTNEISVELSEQLTQRSRDINEQLKAFSEALPEKEKLESAKALFDRIREGVTKLAEEAAKRFADLKKVTAEIGELRAEYKQRVTDIQNKLQEQLLEAARDRDIALSEAQRDADMARTEAVREAGLERAEIERDSQLAIQRILRRSKLDINNAIQNRDAVALDAARARRDEELAAEESNRAERLRKLDIELREQLRTIDIRLKEQNRTIAMRYDEQVRRAALAAQKSIEIETAKFNKELALKAQEAADILGIEQQKVNTTVTKAQETLTVASNFWNNMVSLANRALTASNAAKVVRPTPGNPNIQVRPGQRIPTMDTGGRILSDGLIYAHAGEQIVNPKRGQRAGGGDIVFAPQINGMNKTQIRRELTRQLDRFVEENF